MAMMIHAHPTDLRQFLKIASALVVSIGAPLLPAADAAPSGRRWPAVVPTDRVDSFLAMDAHGMVTVYCGHVDLGIGVHTALAQIVAEEIDVTMGPSGCRPRRYPQGA
jgi:nicotinate dehydrogenase subunit B